MSATADTVDRRRTLRGPAAAFFQYQGREALCEGGTRCGKAQRLSSAVWTPSGPVRMGDIRVGDEVVGGDGKPTRVIGVYDQPVQTIFKIVFSTGETTHATAEHLWDCFTRPNHKTGKVKRGIWTTEQIRNRLVQSKRFDIWIPQAITEFKERDLPIPPYVLGVLLGDGSLTTNGPAFTKAARDIEIVERVERLIPGHVSRRKGGRTYGICGLNDALRGLELLGKKSVEKHIPDIYKRASIQQRIDLLRGLMDTDGTVEKIAGMPRWGSSSSRLAADFLEVIQSLGGAGRIRTKKAYCNGKRHADHHEVSFRYDNARELFLLARKRDRVNDRSKFKVRRLIRTIEPMPTPEPARCIQVAAADGLYLTDNFIVTHNTWALLLKIDFIARNHPGARILVCRQTRVSLDQSVLTDWRNEILWIGHPAIRASSSLERQNDYVYQNGSLVYFAGLENMRDTASPILSTKWDLIFVIQAEETTQNDWEVLATRLSSFKVGYHQLIADCNPAAPSHWLNTRFAPEKCGPDRQRFSFRHYDNPLFYEGLYPNGRWTKEGSEYMGILESTLTGVRRERFLKSRWVAAEGVILENYDPRVHCVHGELERSASWGWMIHLKGNPQPIRVAYFTAGIDFGWHPDPGAMQLWAYDSPKWHPQIRRFRCDEIIRLKWQQEEWADVAVDWHKTYGVKMFSADPHDPENISAFNLRLGKTGGRSMGSLVVKCPPIGGGHRRSPILEPQIDLLRDGLGNPKTKHVRTYYLQRWSQGIDEELRRTGRPATEEQEIESWTYALNPDGSPTMKPNAKCDEHGISADRYDQTLNFARGFGRELAVEERHNPDTHAAEWARHARAKKKGRKGLSWE